MRKIRTCVIGMSLCAAAGVVLCAAISAAPGAANSPGASDLGGTAWRLLKFAGGDDKVLVAGDPQQYTVAFAAGGGVSVRIACNRGHGTWKSEGTNQLTFGPLALTRAMCPPDPMQDRFTKDWAAVRSYIIKEGHLFVSLLSDAGTYEFEPIPAHPSGEPPKSVGTPAAPEHR